MTRLPGSVPRIIGTLLTDTSQTTLFTADDGYAIPTDIHVANISGSAVSVTIEYSPQTGGTVYTLVKSYDIQPNSTGLHLSDDDGLGFQIATGGTIRATAGAANALHVSLGVIELGGRSSG